MFSEIELGQVYTWRHEGRDITFTWLGKADVAPQRVYAFAFTDSGEMLLVREVGQTVYVLPGGGVEAGEDAQEALRRELAEEAAATLTAFAYLGAQRAFDPLHGESVQAFYWARVGLANEFVPETEVVERRLLSQDNFLDTLFWGRRDPKGEWLLARAAELDRLYSLQKS